MRGNPHHTPIGDPIIGSIPIHTSKPQPSADTLFIPKRKPPASRKPQSKRKQPTPRRKPPPPTPKPRKPALTRQERKQQGLCCYCRQPAMPEQTRCLDCGDKHRARNRQDSENRRRAKGIKPRRRISPELIEQIQQDLDAKQAHQAPKRVRNEAYKQKRREKQASLRAERQALGLCSDCGKSKPEGQTRCADCVVKHSQYWQRYVAKAAQRKLESPENTLSNRPT